MTFSTSVNAINVGDTGFTLPSQPTNLKPGMPIVIDSGVNQEWLNVALTYTGGTSVTINGSFSYPHLAGCSTQWDGNTEPGLTGS